MAAWLWWQALGRRRQAGMVCVALGVFCLALAALGLTQRGPDPAACKAAVSRQFDHAVAHPSAAAPGYPAACQGLSAEQMERITAGILAGR